MAIVRHANAHPAAVRIDRPPALDTVLVSDETVGIFSKFEGARCFGWIDGQLGSFDADWFVIRFTPR